MILANLLGLVAWDISDAMAIFSHHLDCIMIVAVARFCHQVAFEFADVVLHITSIKASNDIAFEGDIAMILWPHTYIIAIIARTEILQMVVVDFRNVNRLRTTSI